MGEGRTVDEAIKAALAELGASKADVNIEVVQEPAAKLFGLKREPALVRLTLKKRSKPAPHNFATVAVVNGGGLVYTAPEGRPGTPARLKFGPELKVSYNGEPVEKEVLLERGLDSLEITLPEKKGARAQLRTAGQSGQNKGGTSVEPHSGYRLCLSDRKAANQLSLQLKKNAN